MTESISVSVKSRSGGKIYLDGTACGDSGKDYCLSCYVYSDKVLIPVKNYYHDYTYFNGGRCISISSYACYVDDHGDGIYRFYLDEISGTCENVLRAAAADNVEVTSEPENVVVNILIKDQHDTKIAGAKVTIPTAQGATTITTNYQGLAVGFTLEKSTFHTADITYLPSDWEKTSDSTRTFVPTGDSTYVLYVNKKVTECTLDFYVCDQDAYPVNGATCFAGGKTATTNVNGMCSLTLICGGSYTATCNAPSEYTCDCGGCKCSDAFVLTGDGFLTFMLDKVSTSIEYCQQDFKVLDQNGKPVASVIIGCEDRADHTNFEVLGHAGTGTQSDGTVSTLKTIKGRAYNFYISQFPAGYDIDTDGVNLISDVVACTQEALFRIKNLSTIPDPCSVNVCVQDQDGNQITGVAIYIKDIGTVVTKGDISMFGCTGKVGLTCGNSTTVTATVPSGYEGVKTTETFTASGDKTVILTIAESANGVVCTGKTKAQCDAEPNCYWWASDSACHNTPEPTSYPTLKITSDVDTIGGIVAYVDGTLHGVTPIIVTFTEGDIGKTVSVSGVLAGIMGTRGEDVVLKAGSNEVMLDLLMDNKEILAGGTVVGALLINYGI